MTRVSVISVLSSRDFGAIFTGMDEAGRRVRIRTFEPVWTIVGEIYEIQGTPRIYRDSYGRSHVQIDDANLTRIRSSGRLLTPWLRSLPGIGETRASRLLDTFGEDLLTTLGHATNLDALAKALEPSHPALAMRLAARIQRAFQERLETERDLILEAAFYQRLEALGVENGSAARSLWGLLGRNAWDRLCKRPYSAAAVLPWRQVDHLGLRLMSAKFGTKDVRRHPDRLTGAVDSVIRDLLISGDTAVLRGEMLRQLGRKSVPALAALEAGLERRRILQGPELLHAPGAAFLERDLHAHIERLRSGTPALNCAREVDVRCAVEGAERSTGLALTDEQRKAVCVLLQQRIGLLQGGAGTGKTTSMRVLVAAWERLGGRVEAAALTSKAALKLRQSTQLDVLTIAQLLRRLDERARLEDKGRCGLSDERSRQAQGDAKKRLPLFTTSTILLLDEASMVDLPAIRQLAARLPTGASLLLVGDVAQLQPVGIGQVYHDLVHAGVGLVALATTLRQAAGNPLLNVAAAIRDGRVPLLPRFDGPALGTQIAECSLDDVPARIGEIRAELAGDDGNILALAARQKTVRAVCQAAMMERQREGVAGTRISPLCPWVAVGDPVVMTAPHQKFGLANGQLGRVTCLEPVRIFWDGDQRDREVMPDYRVDIALAWAITCHKSQGSDAQTVVIGLDSQAMLTRQWLYTAVTRARKQAVLVGPQEMIAAAVGNVAERTTGFARLAACYPRLALSAA